MTRIHYFTELESVRQNLIRMGETTVSLFDEALRTAVEPNPEGLAKVSKLEAETDHQHRMIHDQCLNLITLQAPVARDARLITGVLDAIVDLELIGDYAYEIAALTSALRRRPPSQILAQIAEAAARVKAVLTGAIDGWRGDGGAIVSDARSQELSIRFDCRSCQFASIAEPCTRSFLNSRPRLATQRSMWILC